MAHPAPLTRVIRAFLAIVPPAPVRQTIARRSRELAATLPQGVRWVPPANYHVTLAFLGDQTPAALEQLVDSGGEALGAWQPFSLGLGDVAGFPRRDRPGAVVALASANPPLHALYSCLQDLLAGLAMPTAAGSYRPHLTLGRVRREGRREVTNHLRRPSLPLDLQWQVGEVALWASELRPEGAKYRELATLTLGPPGRGVDS